MPVTLDDAVAFITGGGLVALLTTWFKRKKMKADGRSAEIRGELQIVDSAIELTKTLNQEIAALHQRLNSLEAVKADINAEIRDLRSENLELRRQLQSALANNKGGEI